MRKVMVDLWGRLWIQRCRDPWVAMHVFLGVPWRYLVFLGGSLAPPGTPFVPMEFLGGPFSGVLRVFCKFVRSDGGLSVLWRATGGSMGPVGRVGVARGGSMRAPHVFCR